MERVIKEYLPYFIVIIVVILIKVFVATPIKVNGPSMNDTLQDGDIMILDEISYRFKDIKRFDIVVINYTKDDGEKEHIIKRVIGLPGEKIEYKNNKLFINGKYVKENFLHKDTRDFEEVELEEGTYFVMGDNRVNSLDSRSFGYVDRKDIKGRAKLVIFPFNRFGKKN